MKLILETRHLFDGSVAAVANKVIHSDPIHNHQTVQIQLIIHTSDIITRIKTPIRTYTATPSSARRMRPGIFPLLRLTPTPLKFSSSIRASPIGKRSRKALQKMSR
jgi:hypothetical protein